MFPSPAYRPNHLSLMLILTLAGVEKNREDDVLKNDFEKDAATGPMTGDVIICFAN